MLGMSRQEMYDLMMAHLRNQKVRSETKSGCMYRGPNGLKCAIGALIPDSMYNEKMEGRSPEFLYENFKKLRIRKKDIDFLNDMQELHDTFLGSDRFEIEAKNIADKLGRYK